MKATHHIIHDIDRDGFGSAALLARERGAERCRMYPTREKYVVPILLELELAAGDHIWVLDIPNVDQVNEIALGEDLKLTWVDHHPVNYWGDGQDNIELVLHRHPSPTTTMHLLLENDLVKEEGASEFIAMLCGQREATPWVRAFDALEKCWPELPVPQEDLPVLLAGAVNNAQVPQTLDEAMRLIEDEGLLVERILEEAPTELLDGVMIIRLFDCQGIPLKKFSLAAQSKYKCDGVVLVHRGYKLYCGTRDARLGVDFIEHFGTRGLTAIGHPYVAFVDINSSRIEKEILLVCSYVAQLKSNNKAHDTKA